MTHEEFREARERSRVLAFVQEGVSRELRQEEFVREVQGWGAGLYTASFTTPDELRDLVTEALHREEIARAVGPVDEAEMLKRARKLIPDATGTVRGPSLGVVIAGGPKQQVLRPAELEKSVLHKNLRREALLGDTAVLNPSQGSEITVLGDQLSITQDDNSITLDQTGTIRIVQALRKEESSRSMELVPIEEDVQEAVRIALMFGSWVWDCIHDKARLTHAVPIVSLLNAGYKGWKTRDEHRRDPNRATLSMHNDEAITVTLSPASRPRPAMRVQKLLSLRKTSRLCCDVRLRNDTGIGCIGSPASKVDCGATVCQFLSDKLAEDATFGTGGLGARVPDLSVRMTILPADPFALEASFDEDLMAWWMGEHPDPIRAVRWDGDLMEE